jgi:PAS domain S-box-containing protein
MRAPPRRIMLAKLKQELTKLKHGDHICPFYDNTGEQLAVAVPFIIDGLARGERCIYIADDCTIEEVVQALATAGVDVALQRRRRALRLLTRQDTCLRAGEFAPQAMIDFIRQAEAEALADGFSGLRQIGEMTWMLGPEPGCDRLIEFEALVNRLLTNSKTVGVCQYNRSRFDAPCIHDVIRTHPLVILDDQVCANPYYESPEMVLSNGQAATTSEFTAKRVDWWIAQLKRARTAEEERQRALEKLEQSERRFAEAQKVAHVGSWERDLRTNQVSWSDELYRLFGLQANEVDLSYQQFLNLLVPQDGDRIRTLVDEAIRERRSFNCDYRITLPDGTVHVLNDRGSVIMNEEGEPIRLVGTVQDITERKQTERALQESHNLLRAVIESIPEMLFVKDNLGRYLVVNSKTARFVGKPAEDILGRDDAALFDPETARQFMDVDRRVIETRHAETYEKSGPAFANHTYLTTKTPFWGPDGEVRGVLGISRDVTKQKQAEEELKRQKVIFQTIFDHIPVMINFVDPAGRVQLVNRHWERMLGWSLEEAQTHDLFSECHPDPTERARAMEYLRHPSLGWKDFKNRVRDGRILDTSWAVTVLPDGTRIGFGQDITEQKQAEQALAKYAVGLQALSRRLVEVQEEERRHLARELHDEFGQILASITLHLHAARRAAGAAALPKMDECARLLQQAGEQVRNLALELRPTMLDTLGLDATLRWLAKQHQQRTGCEVQVIGHLSVAPLTPELAIACFRVAQEALTNVVRHASARQVWIELSQSESVLELIVRDDGVGFDVAPTQEQAAGRGHLGLLGMAERVQLLGGTLEVISEPGRGTRIRASFPLREAPEQREPEEKEQDCGPGTF